VRAGPSTAVRARSARAVTGLRAPVKLAALAAFTVLLSGCGVPVPGDVPSAPSPAVGAGSDEELRPIDLGAPLLVARLTELSTAVALARAPLDAAHVLIDERIAASASTGGLRDEALEDLLTDVRTLAESTLRSLLGAGGPNGATPAPGTEGDPMPGLLPAREPDRAGASSDDLMTALVTAAGDLGGDRSQLIMELVRDPMVGDLGAWQRDPLGVIALVRATVAGATTASALDAALLEIPGELTRALGYATVLSATTDPELARHAALQGGARLGVVLVAIELAIETLGGSTP
jgi:hypothetical protein